MDARVLVLVLLCGSGNAAAQKVHKCVEAKGTVYQSEPCTSGQAARTWDAKPDVPDAQQKARLQAIQRELDARKRPQAAARPVQRGVQGAAISMYRDPERCEAARAQRAAAFETAGSRRTFELTRRMDDLVFDACK